MEYKKSLLKCLVLAAGTMLLGSCEKNFLNVNNNPNSPSSADPALVFSNALQQTTGVMTDLISGAGPSGANSLCYPMSYYSLSSNYQIDFTITRNDYTTNDFTNVWSDAYHNLNDYTYVIRNSEAQGKWFLAAASKVMLALDYQILVDCYNDVPYSQALSLVDSGVSQPAYDKGQAVYNAILGQIDSAITIFENPTLLSTYSVGAADIMWGGSVQGWVQFANSLKLRILMHEVNVASQASTIQTELANIAADQYGLMGQGVSALINPGYASDAQDHVNPLYYLNGYTVTGALTDPDITANSYFISKLGSYNDPRLGYFYGATGGAITGNPFGQPSNSAANFLGGPTPADSATPYNSGIAPTGGATWGILASPTNPFVIMSSWESLFLQAEATERGLMPGGPTAAQTFYQQAVSDHFTFLNVYTDGVNVNSPSSFATTYLSQPIVNVGWAASSANLLQCIITQKYISLGMIAPLEAWTDYRRTGFPSDLPTSNDPARKYDYAFRLIYPQTEFDTNEGNVKAEGTVTPVSPKPFWMP
jgi:hypothetical protein